MTEKKPTRWQPIETAPYNTPVRVKVGLRVFPAILVPGASLTADEEPCDQWQATTDLHPECWTDGACWESNADEQKSVHPFAWKEIDA